jgi:hypothetical protein
MSLSDWPWRQPTVLVLNAPDVKLSPARHPCLICTAPTSISGQGLATLTELREHGSVVLAVCYSCHLRLNLDGALGGHTELTGPELRSYKGLDG